MKCTKCNKEIKPGEGCFNFPSGIQCTSCGDNRDKKEIKKELNTAIKGLANLGKGIR